ncbi:hypothetical protein C8Q77DRAFT_1153141 [Trametes polyzona]|nr:hypothetical protein C8Q77DRAFT_1153141 [Trametes polyzona]
MQLKTSALLALSAAAVVQAAPELAKRDNGFETFTLPGGTTTIVVPTGTVSIQVLASFLDAHSALFESLVGTQSLLKAEATLAAAEAEEAIGTATQLSAVVTTINSMPVVEVSSIGGNQVITIATGTAGATTIFGGEVFTAVPNAAEQLDRIPRGLWAGVAAIFGSMALGAAFVL